MSRVECKEKAREILKNQWPIGFVVILIQSLIASALSSVTFGIGLLLLQSSLLIAVYNVFINGYAGKKYEINDMLIGVGDNLSNKICLSVLKTIYLALWSLLFVIPGIVKTYSYYVAEFIAMKNPELSASECITKSREIMDGHKWELFVFQLSFIGWHLLAMLTCGILYIWVYPYIIQATIVYIDKNIYKLVDDKPVEEVIEATLV